jgi:hypothetical protein
MTIGRLEVMLWRDTGSPRFRLFFWRHTPGLYKKEPPDYRWIFKVLSWWTLWVAWKGEK